MPDSFTDSQPRRIGEKDRKTTLTAGALLFPPASDAEADDLAYAPKELLTTAPDSAAPTADHAPSAAPPHPPAKPVRRGCGGCLPNLLTLVFGLAAIGIGAYFTQIWREPYSPLNPFPPFTPFPLVVTATFMPPTPTTTPTPVPTATFTPIPLPPSATPNPFNFSVANDGAVYIPNSNGQGCAWSSIAGTVTDKAGQALDGYGVRVRGGDLDKTVFSGSAETYGPGGFELPVGLTAQVATFSVQLFTPDSVPASPELTVITRANCTQNVAVLNFFKN